MRPPAWLEPMLAEHGITQYTMEQNRHLKVRFIHNGQPQLLTVPLRSRGWRLEANTRRCLRQKLRSPS